jgi:hypothetical protein
VTVKLKVHPGLPFAGTRHVALKSGPLTIARSPGERASHS